MVLAEKLVSALFFFIGGFSLLAALFNWDWFFSSANASIFLRWLGRRGARYLYGIIGAFVMILGILMFLGKLE